MSVWMVIIIRIFQERYPRIFCLFNRVVGESSRFGFPLQSKHPSTAHALRCNICFVQVARLHYDGTIAMQHGYRGAFAQSRNLAISFPVSSFWRLVLICKYDLAPVSKILVATHCCTKFAPSVMPDQLEVQEGGMNRGDGKFGE